MADAEGSGGTAYGLNATADNADEEMIISLGRVMTAVAEWIGASAGCFLGHVKMAVSTGNDTVTLSLTSMDVGVERHGKMTANVPADIKFMAAVVDVDGKQLAEKMRDAMLANGFKVKNKKMVELR
ncbi:MAG: hypothetical protein FWH44_05990 [Methanomassiliicoccaceae archaeon]|nr:hypothetical protein [Methanomassiliicoccaceae archaeon]